MIFSRTLFISSLLLMLSAPCFAEEAMDATAEAETAGAAPAPDQAMDATAPEGNETADAAPAPDQAMDATAPEETETAEAATAPDQVVGTSAPEETDGAAQAIEAAAQAELAREGA